MSEQTVLPDDAHVRNTVEEGLMGSSSVGQQEGPEPNETPGLQQSWGASQSFTLSFSTVAHPSPPAWRSQLGAPDRLLRAPYS